MSGRIAIITGAGSGIGRAVALKLAENGYRLVLAGNDAAALEETAGSFAANALEPLCIETDVTSSASVDAMFRQTVGAFGRLDLLFNNAGISGASVPIEEVRTDDWRAVIDVNLTGAFLCLRGAFGVMKTQTPVGGRIINNGSVSAQSPRPFSAAYTASKHALTGLTKSASLEGRAFNIVCSQIDLGNVSTDWSTKMATGVPQANGTTASEPVMNVDNVAKAILFMDGLPMEANVPFMTLMASGMPFIGRG
jgi:NAD(P)-dependent dehydrogenase (short-subunit alcohol dehydrogenase family)